MGDGAPIGRVGLTAFYRLQDVQVVQDVRHAAVIGQPIEKGSNRLLCFLRREPFTLGR